MQCDIKLKKQNQSKERDALMFHILELELNTRALIQKKKKIRRLLCLMQGVLTKKHGKCIQHRIIVN